MNANLKEIKLYSKKGISIATFCGSPLAASILMRSNYRALGREDDGKTALTVGVIFTILMFVLIYMIPESIMSKVPNSIIPAVYTGLIYYIVDKLQGSDLERHEAEGNTFISNWIAAGIGLLCSVLIFGGILAYSNYESSDPAYVEYEQQFEKFIANETESLEFYNHFDAYSNERLLQELRNVVIPNWKENIRIVEKSNAIENLPDKLKERNVMVLDYCNLNIDLFTLYRKAIAEDTDIYNSQLEDLQNKINLVLDEVNRM